MVLFLNEELGYSITLNGIDSINNITAAIPIMTKYRLLFEKPVNGGGKMVICEDCNKKTYGAFDEKNSSYCGGHLELTSNCRKTEIVRPELFFWE